MFAAAIVAGATSMGVDVHLVGVVPTPALSYITGAGIFAQGSWSRLRTIQPATTA